jgi:bifunctional ADP-heptose synthase (sugar kinase/adenylyltransferase)
VPVLQIQEKVTNPGMAANVLRNLKMRISECEIITNSNWESVVKTRFVHETTNHMFLRVDSKDVVPPFNMEKMSLNYEVIVISDYNKGFLTQEDIEYICNNHPNVFLDTKKVLGNWARRARIIKINDYEYHASKPFITGDLSKKIIHTRGEFGCDFRGKNYPVSKVEIRDTSGAGDSFMAALVAEYLVSKDIQRSILAANAAASTVVRGRGVGTI